MFVDDINRIKEPAGSFILQLDLYNLCDRSEAFNLSQVCTFGIILHLLILVLMFRIITLMVGKLLFMTLLKIFE